MSEESLQLLIIIFGAIATGAAASWAALRLRMGSAQAISASILDKAEKEAAALREQVELDLKRQQLEQERRGEQQLQQERSKLQREEERLKAREDRLEQRCHTQDRKIAAVEKLEASLQLQKSQLDHAAKELALEQSKLQGELQRISGLSAAEAKDHLFRTLQTEVERETAQLIARKQREAEESSERLASTIIATAINRLCVPCVSDVTVTSVALPSDEMKGRIIGREGRNIKMLERELGVNILIDDTPGAIVLSGFDPMRKQIAKLVLAELLQDGRIHPTRIQEVIDKKRLEMGAHLSRLGEDAALRAGVLNLHPHLHTLLGQLKFRHSYSQNVLDHSLEVSFLLGLMAAELGLDSKLAKRIGLLHDIGKAVSHEVDGSHAIIGHDLALRYGESKEVANGIGCHHHEMPAETIEGSLCSAADSLSASRPGARMGAIEEYVKRLKDLEEITYAFPGVDRAYALQAGREVHISVLPDAIDDAGVINLAKDVRKRIEEQLKYPGRVKVTVVREKRVVEYAN